MNKTPLYSAHVDAGAKIVDFSGWALPIQYTSQLDEHHIVRRDAGMFDVSHMTVVDIYGADAESFLRYLLANDVARLKAPGKALYSCMLNPEGGVIDDLICYRFDAQNFRVVVNAATREKDLAWIRKQAEGRAVAIDFADDVALIAVQGPKARAKAAQAMPQWAATIDALSRFQAQKIDNGVCIARTGYTGEDGLEIILPATEAIATWQALLGAGVQACGLGARDTLRLEAGMALYGNDLDEQVSPLSSGLNWTIDWRDEKRDFIGRSALVAERAAANGQQMIGLLLEDKGVLRGHLSVLVDGQEVGQTTSGGFSPTTGRSIALARVSDANQEFYQVAQRSRVLRARRVAYPFVANDSATFSS